MIERVPELFLSQLRREAFALDAHAAPRERFGAEVEFIPVESATGRIAPIDSGTLPVLRAMCRRLGWLETSSAKAGVPEVRTTGGGRVTFEPGGQLEYSAPPRESVSALLADLHAVASVLSEWLAPAGIDLVSLGVDPTNPIEHVPMQLTAERYRRMNAHFATIGPHGARMMRQTASIQVCLDTGPRPLERWRLLNALAPYLSAIFANSPAYAGETNGHQSVRRFIWGALDPLRTGMPYDASDPVGAYARFALNAPAILCGEERAPFVPFRRQVDAGAVGLDEWRAHLTTLFPEVRPRGYFEVRSVDALDPSWYAAPLAFIAGLTCDPGTARVAAEIAGDPDESLLARAGRCALSDPDLAARAAELFDLALGGCESLGPRVLAKADLERAREFAERYTRRALAPAADAALAAGA